MTIWQIFLADRACAVGPNSRGSALKAERQLAECGWHVGYVGRGELRCVEIGSAGCRI